MRPVITLTTDFGAGDDEAGVLKGVIWQIAPQAQIADLSHEVSPQNVLEGALLLGRTARYFPAGTVHVGVVDPGVGTRRRGIAARLGDQLFVGPDNGLLTQMLARAERSGGRVEIVALDRPEFWLPEVTSVFHGRDIFSPVAAHLASGTPLSRLGSPVADPARLEIPQPIKMDNGWSARVLYVDSFGNLGTNLSGSDLDGLGPVLVRIAGREIRGLVQAFGDQPAGELVALIDSSGFLSVCIVNGDAARELSIGPGEIFEVVRQETGPKPE